MIWSRLVRAGWLAERPMGSRFHHTVGVRRGPELGRYRVAAIVGEIIGLERALVQKVAQPVHGLTRAISSSGCRHACGNEKARTAASMLLSDFNCDSGAAAVWSAAILLGNQHSEALTIASRVGKYPSGQKSVMAWPLFQRCVSEMTLLLEGVAGSSMARRDRTSAWSAIYLL